MAEHVTFGGSGLDRAAHLRERGFDLWPKARVMVLWRGKIAVTGDDLLWLPADHPSLTSALLRLFMGLDDTGEPLFAADLPDWQGAEAAAGFIDPTVQAHPDLPDGHGFHDLRQVMTLLSPRGAELAATARAMVEWHRSHGFCARCGAASQPSHTGWQRHCPACDSAHFPRTDPVVIMLVTDGNRLLLGRNAQWPEGMYSLLAGFIEPGETVEAAVRRETFEETGIRVGTVRYLASQPWPFPASLMLGCHATAISDTIQVDPAELEDALWITREELVSVAAGTHPVIKPARKGAIAQYLISNWLADRLE